MSRSKSVREISWTVPATYSNGGRSCCGSRKQESGPFLLSLRRCDGSNQHQHYLYAIRDESKQLGIDGNQFEHTCIKLW